MKNNLLIKYLIKSIREYILIFLTATIFLFITFTKSFSTENVFVVNNVEIEGAVDLSFSREKYLNKAFLNSFEILMSKILLSSDLNMIANIDLKEIKNLINSFQILNESFKNDDYKINIKILYNESKVKEFLGKKSISFSHPENITVLFYPALFINGEMRSFNENSFYKEWEQAVIKNQIINFILPIDDLDDISELAEMKDRTEELNIDSFVNKYEVKNYVFAFIDHTDKKLNIHLKINFNNNKISKNILYKINDLDNQDELNLIIKNLKLKITDIWKKENLINIALPLSIDLKFKHINLKNLDKVKNDLEKISIINNYVLKEFNINSSFFKIYYYGDPKKLKLELLKFGYQLEDAQGYWQLYLNE